MLTDKQLAGRHGYIGGSDGAAIVGLSKWKTPYDVWLSKVSPEQPEKTANEPMKWGNILEPVIREELSPELGEITLPDTMFHPEVGYVAANVDGLFDNGRKVLEIKTSGMGSGFGENGSNEIPEEYWLQVQHYMMVTGAVEALVAALIRGNDLRRYRIERDWEVEALLLEKYSGFWNLVQSKTPPEAQNRSEVERIFKAQVGKTAYADGDIVEVLSSLKERKNEKKKVEVEIKALESEMALYMTDSEILLGEGGDTIFTWKEQTSKRFDTTRFKTEHPEVYGQFLKSGTSRVMKIK